MAEETKPKPRRGRRPRRSLPKELPEIFFCGDPHGEFAHINEAAREYKPKAMVILGDMQPPAPLEVILAEALKHTEIWWIPGNHDTDTDEFYDYLWRSDLASHNLHGRVANVAGLRIAGLGGVFRGQVWMPDGQPNYFCPATFIRRVGAGNIWRGGLPRRHRSTIFPSVYQSLLKQRADILVTHEAAGCHRKGFCASLVFGTSRESLTTAGPFFSVPQPPSESFGSSFLRRRMRKSPSTAAMTAMTASQAASKPFFSGSAAGSV